MEMKLISIDFFCRVVEYSRHSWLQILDNQLINHSPYIKYTTITANVPYCIIFLEYINESHMNLLGGQSRCAMALFISTL